MLKFCPKCGAKVLTPTAKFCMECGFNFGELNQEANGAEISESAPQNNTETNIVPSTEEMETELSACQEYAERGYKLAQEKFDEMQKTLSDERDKLNNADNAQEQLRRLENTELIQEQKDALSNLSKQMETIQADIDMLHERQKDFSIIIYGRTMAGKSTLMEILTHGNGESIGKGAQRTTLDVRDYYWQGLRITDVPGVCSFGGEEDDKLAFEAARSADLILFLLTDDAPQAGEAECLAQLKSLGKPVLGVVNVKMAFDIAKRNIALRNLNKRLADTQRLNTICQQFKNFAGNYSQDWGDIEFVYTHLNAAFQAQPERGNDAEVFAASQFGRVEKFILDKVRSDGKFLRIKNFVDIAAVPTCQILTEIYAHAAKSLAESRIWRKKLNELLRWRKKFVNRTFERAESLKQHIKSQVKQAMDPFVDKYYESDKVGELWEKEINNLNLNKKYNDFLQEVADECDRKRKELSDELTQELRFSFTGNSAVSVEMGSTTPYAKYAWHIASNALMFVPGIGWAARIGIGVGGLLIGMLFDNKEEKIKENKKKLREALSDGTWPMIDKMHDNLIRTIRDKIIGEGIDGFAETLAKMDHTLAKLGYSQELLANGLNEKYKALNTELLQEAVSYGDKPGFVSSINDIARVPGQQFIMIADKFKLDDKAISRLLGEEFQAVSTPQGDERANLLENVLGAKIVSSPFPVNENAKSGDDELAELCWTDKVYSEVSLSLTEQLLDAPIMEGERI